MSGLPLDDQPGGPGFDSGVFPHVDVREAAEEQALCTGDLEWREIRDALWLARAIHPDAEPRSPTAEPPAASTPPAESPPPSPPSPRPSESEPPSATEEHEPSPAEEQEPQDWSVGRPHPVRTAVYDRHVEGETAPLVWPTAPALRNRRRIARALRVLSRRTASPFGKELDEEATAERAALDRMWLPEFRPATWHEFELVVVVDTAGAADVWQQMVNELCDLFRRQGAFRNVRVLLLDGAGNAASDIVLRTGGPDGAERGWRDEIDPTGRSVFLVLTDGVGEGWRTGAATRVVASWARHTPTALVNLLPDRLWHWSRLIPRRVRLRAESPGVPNVGLRVRTESGFLVKDESAVPIPMLGLTPEWWSSWAKLLAVPGAGWVDSTTIFVEPDAVVEEVSVEPDDVEPEEIPPKERVLRFRAFASVPAFQLAMLLAAVPLSMSTMKFVQRVLLPSADISAVAEVLLGGLLRKTPLRPDAGDGVDYEFHSGVREELLAGGSRGDTVRVARLVGDHLSARNPIVRNFRDALTDPDRTPEPDPTPETRPYLRVQEAVFRALSGRYAPRARRLRLKLGKSGVVPGSGTALVAASTITEPTPSLRSQDDAQTLDPRPMSEGDQMTASGLSHSGDTGRTLARQPQIWGSVPLRNPDFVGREELLEQLRRRLMEPGEATAVLPEALHGMGGVGKSQTVVEYIYRHATEYEIVWWIPSEHTTQIRSSFVDLAKRLGIKAGSAETAVPLVLEALRTGMADHRWILVFDNAEDPAVVRQFLPSGMGHVVVTSRNSEWGTVARTVEVDLFTRAESKELLSRRGGGNISDSDADRLAEALGDLPLAVEQAASWRAQTGMPVTEYVGLLEQNSAELLQAGATSEYELPVAAAWNVPLKKLKDQRRGALELLQVCAFFSPEPIARSLFTGVRGDPVPAALAEVFADPIKLNHAIREINRYSLAKIDHSRNTLQLHRLVQAVLRDQLDRTQWENMRQSVHLMLVNGDPGDPENAVNWPVYAELLPHALNSKAVENDDKWVRRLVTHLVSYLIASGDYQGALSLAESARDSWTTIVGPNDVDTLNMGRHIGNALRRVGRVADARAISNEVYKLMSEHLGDDHEATIAMADVLLVEDRVEGRFYDERDKARGTLERARRAFGEDEPTTLRYANTYASRLRVAGDYFAARELDSETLRRRAAMLGDNHGATLNTRSCLAMDIRECGQYVEACEMQEVTSQLTTEVLGRDHPTTIGGDRCLAVARRMAGLHDKAMELTEDCYNRYRMRHGEGHLDTVTGLMDMASELRHARDLEKSLDFGLRSVQGFERIYYPEHPFAMIAVTNLAVTRRLIGDVDEARSLNERAVTGLLERLRDDHPYVLVARANLASDLAELGEVEKARQLDVENLERCKRVLGDEHPTSLALSHNLSMDLNLLGNADEAAILHTQTSASFRKVLGENHPATLAASHNVRANCDTDTMQL